jgi:hypothetical protein
VSSSTDTLIDCSALSEAQRLAAAKLAAEAMSALYDPVGDEVIPMLAEEFCVEGSELADSVALVETTVDGLVASYPSEEYQTRQRVSLHHALGYLSREAGGRLIAQLRVLADQIPVVSLHVRSDNVRAIGFYRRHGFVQKTNGEFHLMQRG